MQRGWDQSKPRAGLLATLVLGVLAGAPAWSQPAVVGEWSEPFPWADNATHATLFPSGKVLTWNEFDPKEFHLWDPATGAFSVAAFPGYNMFCSGHSLLADGRLLVSGGSIETNRGLPYASIYDPASDTWTRLPDMNDGRWYPTNTTLPNGDVLVTAGTVNQRKLGENRMPQVWQASLGTWRDLTGAMRTVEQYPWMFVAPNGKVFMAGPDPMSAWLDTSGAGAWTEAGARAAGEAVAGSAVMYDDGKILATGGGERFPTDAVEVIDLNNPAPAWRTVQPMGQPRKQHNLTLLPDGTVLVTGGSSGPGKDDVNSPVLPTELWDPATERFTVLASSSRYRGYHSTALLLPDGRVLSTGGQESEDDAQIFSPPYLFKGPRPTLSAAPPKVAYGETFTVSTPDAASITRVTWVRLSSVTHAFNQNQRINRLAFTAEAGGLRVTAPPSGNTAPPGDYLLFILNDQGVPSIGAWIKVGGAETAPAVDAVAVGFGEVWKYDDRGIDPGEGWTQPAFDDVRWKVGHGSFATGGDAGTLLQLADDQPTVYFRKKLRLVGTALGGTLKVQHQDGVEVWLNGNLLLTRNIEPGADHQSYAEDKSEAAQISEASISAGVLVEGENLLAVRVKRVKPTKAQPSPELRFDLELGVSIKGQIAPVPILSLSAPNGGEVLEAGSTYPVAWVTHGALSTVQLEYSMNGGSSWHVIASEVANTGTHDWSVPAVGSAEMLLRVTGGSEASSADVSDSTFSIIPSTKPPETGCADCSTEQPQEPKTQGCNAAGPGVPVLGLLAGLGWALRRRRGRAFIALAPSRGRLLMVFALPGLLGCGDRRSYAIQFAAQVRGEPLRCGNVYENVGAAGTTLELLDFKVYVHDVRLIRKSGAVYPLALESDGLWQREGVALLDFEDGSGSCNTGSPEVRTEVVAEAPNFGDYSGVEFKIGVPGALNHMNVEWTEPPLHVPSMWWSWKNGYKFLRLDVRTGGNRPYVFHAGAEDCEGTPDIGITCGSENVGRISLADFDPDQNRVVFDVAALFANTDFGSAVGSVTDLVEGCLSSKEDPECAPLLPQLGVGAEPGASGVPGAFIRTE